MRLVVGRHHLHVAVQLHAVEAGGEGVFEDLNRAFFAGEHRRQTGDHGVAGDTSRSCTR